MANIPQKSPDPTEDALNAIKAAMTGGQAERRASPPPLSEAPPTVPPADLLKAPSSPEAAERETLPLRHAANDDRAELGLMLQALHKRPTRTSYVLASIAALIWTAGGLAAGYLYSGSLQALFATPRIGVAVVIGLASAIIVPVIFFFVLAHMLRRSQDLRVVAEAMAEVAMRLTQPEDAAREQIVSVGQAIRREVAAMGDGVERALARAAELESLVHNEVSAIERAYNDNEVRIRDLLNGLANQRETLVNQAEHVRNAIAGVHLDLSHDITSVGDLVSDKVSEVAQRVTRSLTEKGEHITLTLGQVGDSMIDTLTDRGSNLLDRLETTGDRATSAITAANDRLTAALTFKTENIHNEFSEIATRVQQMMSARLDQVAKGFAQDSTKIVETMAGRSKEFTDNLNRTGTQMAETIASRADQVNTALRSTGEALASGLNARGNEVIAKLEQTSTSITDNLVKRGDAVAGAFRQNAEALTQTLSTRSDAVRDMLTARLQAFEEMFTHGGTALTEKVSRDTVTLGSLITRHMTEFDRTVKTYGGELVERLGQRTQDVAEAMRNYVDTFDQRLTGHSGDLTGSIDVRLSQFEASLATRVNDFTTRLITDSQRVVDTLDNRVGAVGGIITTRGTEVADAIAARTTQIDETLGARATEVANTLDTRIARFEDLLVGRAETAANQLEARAKNAADAVQTQLDQLGQSIKSNTAEAERSLGQLAATTSETLRASAGDVERKLVAVSAEVARTITDRTDELFTTVGERTAEMTTVLSDKSGGVIAALTQKGQQFATEIGRATEEAVRSIENNGYAFTHAMLDNSSEITRMINAAGETASNSINRSLNDLHATAQQAIEQSKSTVTSTVNEMMETHNMLRADTTALFERLREANIMLQEVLTGSHANMSALENTLMLRVSEFVAAMSEITSATTTVTTRVESNVADFRDVTARVVADLSQLAGQFEAHGRELASAAELVDRSNQRAVDGINQRRTSLEELVAALDARTSDLDQRLARFAGLLDDSLDAAAARAREIARVVSETTTEGGRAIGEQFERVRMQADDERRRTAEAMQSMYERSTAETHAMFSDANERFGETVQDMKRMAAEMRRELEATRAEMNRELEATREDLRRGTLELPQETAESTAQMRRVIVDQIEALAELNRIVARHGRNVDAVEPRRVLREDTPVAAAGGREAARPAPTRGDAGSFAPATRRSEPPPPLTDVGSFAPAARREPPPPPAAPAAGSNAGWLSDLLSRASRESGSTEREPRESQRGPEVRPPRHSFESLDSLSVDIARMIDHEAAADLWDRYKRGERNVFTRRLYTLQGQQAFDEIRRKYRSDREFKLSVDRYIDEFERLLDEASRDGRGQLVARTYLTSETGKVYTMLAHAAGRFD